MPPPCISQGFQWYVTSGGPPRGALVGVNSVVRSGVCLEGEEGKAAPGEGREAGGAPLDMSEADVVSKCCLAGICSSSAPGCAAGSSLCPSRVNAAQGVIPCSPPPTMLLPSTVCPPACLLPGRHLDPPELSHMGSFSSSCQQSPWCFLEPVGLVGGGGCCPCTWCCCGAAPSFTQPGEGSGGVGKGSPELLAAGQVSGPQRGRDVTASFGGRGDCWGVMEQSVATLAVLRRWFEMSILHLSGFPLYF